MGRSTWLPLPKDKKSEGEFTLHDLHDILADYCLRLERTGRQLSWDYAAAAFPYTMEMVTDGEMHYLKLTATRTDLYTGLLLAIEQQDTEQQAIRITLPPNATHGDRGKANEFARYLARTLSTPLRQFCGRTVPS